ncbi:MAG TPA: YdaS family helix-turn-helix protein [Methylocella sp.]|jgi:DNA-binding transcriptional regulator YdaS (Cro superfamily)|nr:YdaS family helix-turn-helix protein [Methylocella sp.]
MDTETPKEALQEALRAIGGAAALARRLGIKQPSVFGWEQVPAGRVLAVEAATGVRRERLRPDIYPPSEAAE